jgi:ribosomal protein L21E|tara:strand:- start:141 stop:443 length:303 start_codon:yes stop_codon:yes gene_type:complete
MQRKGGKRRKTRHLSTKHYRKKGKVSISKYFQTFETGTKVRLSVEPAVNEGMYDYRFYGKSGIVESKRGRCYLVAFKDGGKAKQLIVHPIHLEGMKHVNV